MIDVSRMCPHASCPLSVVGSTLFHVRQTHHNQSSAMSLAMGPLRACAIRASRRFFPPPQFPGKSWAGFSPAELSVHSIISVHEKEQSEGPTSYIRGRIRHTRESIRIDRSLLRILKLPVSHFEIQMDLSWHISRSGSFHLPMGYHCK